MKRLIIDAQVFHTQAWHRGMGKYSVELLAALSQFNQKHKKWDAIELLLSSRFPENQAVTDAIQTRMPGIQQTMLPLKRDDVHNARATMNYNRRIVNQHIGLRREEGTTQTDFLILSPLQGGVCSVFPSDPRVRKSLICYDLIPFMFHKIYFRNPILQIENLTKLGEALKADLFLAISKTVANDLAVHLGVDPARIVNIDGGPIAHSAKSQPIDVPRPFILMPTGNELRKNNRSGILGFGEFNKRHKNQYSLVVTSFFEPHQIAELSKLAPNVVFTGNISGPELDYLYEECEALLFPSEYEGLGLPVLEAVEKNKPVACSDIAVFREMSKTAYGFFNQAYGTSIANALEHTVGSTPDKAEYAAILAKYDWDKTCHAASNALLGDVSLAATDKPKVAVFGPNPELDMPLAKTMQRAHTELARLCEVDYFFEGIPVGTTSRPNMLPFITHAIGISGESEVDLHGYDAILYHLSNKSESARTLFAALAEPGIAILHDLTLQEAWTALQTTHELIDEPRLVLEENLSRQYKEDGTRLLVSVVARQKAIAVYSQAAKQTVEALLSRLGRQAPVVVLRPAASCVVYDDILPDKDGTIGAFGLEAGDPLRLLGSINNALYRKVAIVKPTDDTQQLVAMQAQAVVAPSDYQMEDAMSRLNLTFSAGEESLLEVVETLRYGAIPVYLQMPHAALDAPPGSLAVASEQALNETLSLLAASPKEYDTASRKVAKVARHDYSYAAYARDLLALIMKAGKA